jgi:hypothetical protein
VIAPNICSKEALIGKAEHRTVTDVKAIDVSALLKPPAA